MKLFKGAKKNKRQEAIQGITYWNLMNHLTLSYMGLGRFALEWLSLDHLKLAFPWLRGLMTSKYFYQKLLLSGAY